MNRPSGGMKLSSPGRSFHLASRTHGWKTGSSILRPRACWPPGVDNDSSRSGTPDIFAVNAMVPDTSAESNLPEGAIVTLSDSMMSTYNSLDVCRTPGRLQGIAGPWDALAAASDCFRGLEDPSVGVDVLYQRTSLARTALVQTIATYPGTPIPPSSFPIQPGTSTTSCNALGSVLHTVPPSHISLSNCATTS